MKTQAIILVLLFITISTKGQDRTEIEIFKARFNEQKIDLIASFMDFTTPEGERFWPIYKDYEAERSEVADRRIQLLSQYANSYMDLTNAQAEYWYGEVFKLQQREIKIKRKYCKRMAKALNPLIALRFFQFEESLHAEVRQQIIKNLPPIENY